MDCSRPGSLPFTSSQSLLRFMSTESVMPSNHVILCRVPLNTQVFTKKNSEIVCKADWLFIAISSQVEWWQRELTMVPTSLLTTRVYIRTVDWQIDKEGCLCDLIPHANPEQLYQEPGTQRQLAPTAPQMGCGWCWTNYGSYPSLRFLTYNVE